MTIRTSMALSVALLVLGAARLCEAQLPVAGTPPPMTLWRFLGIPQGVNQIRDATLNRRGNAPRLERKPPLKALADPANLESSNPAIKKAAEIKQEEDKAPQKIKALKYLAKVGCGCYKGVKEALMDALDDCTEKVRYEAAKQIGKAAENKCEYCNKNCCCDEELSKKLAEIAYEKDDNCCWLEPSERVREAAREALLACCRAKQTPPGFTSPASPIRVEEGETVPEKGPGGETVPDDTAPVPGTDSQTRQQPSDDSTLSTSDGFESRYEDEESLTVIRLVPTDASKPRHAGKVAKPKGRAQAQASQAQPRQEQARAKSQADEVQAHPTQAHQVQPRTLIQALTGSHASPVSKPMAKPAARSPAEGKSAPKNLLALNSPARQSLAQESSLDETYALSTLKRDPASLVASPRIASPPRAVVQPQKVAQDAVKASNRPPRVLSAPATSTRAATPKKVRIAPPAPLFEHTLVRALLTGKSGEEKIPQEAAKPHSARDRSPANTASASLAAKGAKASRSNVTRSAPKASSKVAAKGTVATIDRRTGTANIDFSGKVRPQVGARLRVHHEYALERTCIGELEVVFVAPNGRAIAHPVGDLDLGKISRGDEAVVNESVSQSAPSDTQSQATRQALRAAGESESLVR